MEITSRPRAEVLLSDKRELEKRLKELNQELRKEGPEYLLAKSRELFEQYPHMIQFSWTQYTPFYNDGDPCVFSSGHNWADVETDETTSQKQREELSEVIRTFLSVFDDSDMEAIFGDHVQVEIRKDEGLVVSEYEHS
jgi:hypothetical protein